jgi:sigma-B regulation protein RsbU (phosphoserine phosphatase)
VAKKKTTVRRKLDATRALPGVVRHLLAITDPDELLVRTLGVCREALGADEVSLLLVDDDDLVEHEIDGRKLREQRYRMRIGEEGITGISAAHRQTIIVSDVRKDHRYKKVTETTRSEAAIPIIAGERLMGVLNFESSKIGFFNLTDRHLLELLASQIAVGLRLEELHHRGQRLSTQLGMLNNLSRAGTMMEPRAFLQRVVDQVRRTFDSSFAVILVGDYAHERLMLVAQSASSPERLCPTVSVIPFGKGMTGSAFRVGETLNARDVRKDPNYFAHISLTRSELDVPIRAGDRCLGIIGVQSDEMGAFTHDEVQTLETLARFLVPVFQRSEFSELVKA